MLINFTKKEIQLPHLHYLSLIADGKVVANFGIDLIEKLIQTHKLPASVVCFDEMINFDFFKDNMILKNEADYFAKESNYFEVMDEI